MKKPTQSKGKEATTAQGLISRLGIVQENILAEAAAMPALFAEAAVYRVSKMQARASAELELDTREAEFMVRTRKLKEKQGEKATNDAVKELCKSDTHVLALKIVLDKATAREELSKLLLDALKMRRDAIRIIADAAVYEGIHEDAEINRIQARRKLAQRSRELEEKRRSIE